MEPITVINNKPARTTRVVTVRPLKQSGIDLMEKWLNKQTWKKVFNAETVDEKSKIFQTMLLQKVDEFLPEVKRKISSDDRPFCTEKIKRLKRQKSREFRKNQKSEKWQKLDCNFKKEVSAAKKNYYKDIVKDLRVSNPGRWYSILKRICSYDQQKSEPVVVDSIKHLSSKEQAEKMADKFCKVSQEYEPLRTSDIQVPKFEKSEIPSFVPKQVKKHLQKLKANKAVPPGDIPLKLIKQFASQLSIPLCEIINSSIKLGAWSKLWKCESVTPVPKVFPPKSPEELRNISGLLTFDKIAEK